MPKPVTILKYLLIFLISVLATGCVSSSKNSYVQKRKKASTVHASQLGRNRYYFSTGYQKKLVQNYKKKR